MLVRPATAADAPALARIYNQGIEDRTATFETTLRSEYDVLGWFDGVHPIVVVIDEPPSGANDVIAFARATEYRSRECYRGIFEFAVYTDRAHRRRGAGLLAMRELVTRAREAGAWKLVSRIFVENDASRKLVAQVGFREVGTYYRHAKLDERWRDVVIVEKFLAPLGAIASVAPKAPAARGSRGDVLDALRSPNADPTALAQSLDWARAIVDSFQRPDADLLDAVAEAFFQKKAHPAALRTQFVDLFRAYAALSEDASRAVFALFCERLDRIPIELDLEVFYEGLFVLKQIARGSDDALAPHVNALIEWMRAAVEIPSGLRGRISAGNVTSLLMTLATSAGATNEQRHAIAELAVIAKLRHRVDAPAGLQRPVTPAAPVAPSTVASVPPPPPTPRRSVPPPLPHQRASQPDPEEMHSDALEEEAPIPLSSQDLLPESVIEPPRIEEPPAPAPKSKRKPRAKKEPGAPKEPKKRASRSKKKPPPETPPEPSDPIA